jgi:hypothetical protein
MIILTYGGRMSPKHCWKNFTLEQALSIWRNTDDKIPKQAETWWGNKKLTSEEILIANLPWNTRINLMIRGEGGEGGDPNCHKESNENAVELWRLFEVMTENFKEYSFKDKWNIGKVFMYTGNFVYTKTFQKAQMELAGALINDKEKMAQVTKECLDIIKFIEKKIGFVDTIIKYRDNEEEWEYYQFGKNEYQTDLFFIKNTDRIKIMLNIIKKQNPKYKEERCKLACKAASIKE